MSEPICLDCGHARWCRSLNPPPGRAYTCDCEARHTHRWAPAPSPETRDDAEGLVDALEDAISTNRFPLGAYYEACAAARTALLSRLRELEGALGEAAAYLENDEWSAWYSGEGPHTGESCCPDCGVLRSDAAGHDERCGLARLLARARRALKREP